MEPRTLMEIYDTSGDPETAAWAAVELERMGFVRGPALIIVPVRTTWTHRPSGCNLSWYGQP